MAKPAIRVLGIYLVTKLGVTLRQSRWVGSVVLGHCQWHWARAKRNVIGQPFGPAGVDPGLEVDESVVQWQLSRVRYWAAVRGQQACSDKTTNRELAARTQSSAGDYTRTQLRACRTQRNNQSALESSITPPLPTYRPESQLTKRKNVLRSDAALRKNCVFQEKCASDWTHKFLKNASLLIKKGPKRTNSPKIRSL